MHRFRKRSDSKPNQAPPSPESLEDSLPKLPVGDFRTSLILPDLSRRFSVLRSPSGDPVSLDDLRSRFAEQRARGVDHQISEAEEDMLLDTLGRIRSRTSVTPERSQESIVDGEEISNGRQSIRSTAPSSSSLTSSPSGRSAKRYSNNLFGSGRLRDYSYLRSTTSTKSSAGSTRTVSLTPTESSTITRGNVSSLTESLRPLTPEGSTNSQSGHSSPNERGSVRSAPSIPPAPYGEQMQVLSAAEYRLQKTLGPSALKRASLALEEAIKEIEDEVEDEIVMPRTAPIARTSLEQPSHPAAVRDSNTSTSSVMEAGMAISSDKQVQDDLNERRAEPVPLRILPGYIPGMPRPMTPRDIDVDEQRSHSTTPRATSPMHSGFTESSPSTNILKRDSVSSTGGQSPRPTTPLATTPLFLQRSTNGRHTPDASESQKLGNFFELESPMASSVLSRRRPASPLSGPPFQPMSVSSRPSTPSNIIWAVNSEGGNVSSPGPASHTRDNSWASDGGISSSDIHGSIDRHKLGPRPLRSPPLADSPLIERSQVSILSSNQTNWKAAGETPNIESDTLISRGHRSPTPTQNAPRSTTSPAFSNYDTPPRNGSRRSSKQNTPSSAYNIAYPALSFSPRPNSSRSSLESAGSSFHSWDGEKDRAINIFSDIGQHPAWHDITFSDKSSTPGGSGSSPEDEWDAEDVIKRYAGLKKADFHAVQEKLFGVAVAKAANPDPRDRAPSALRRRRPSTSQSNYSINNGRDNRIASPPPPASPTSATTPTAEQYSKANALLNSLADSLQGQPILINPAPTITLSTSDKELSPTSRRNRDLATVLFGEEVEVKESPVKTEQESVIETLSSAPPPVVVDARTQTPQGTGPSSPYLMRNPSTARIPPSAQEEADLTREVQQKTAAAMLALKKRPSNSNLGDGTVSRRRIDTSQISTPQLVSATISVDTIPLRTPSLSASNNSGTSKIGSRFKKLRGSLRAKNVAPSTEDQPQDARTPPASQTVYYDPDRLQDSGSAGMSSATENGRLKGSVTSPSASASPGLKGFMARLRGKRITEVPSGTEHRASPHRLSPSPFSPFSQRQHESPPAWASPPANVDADFNSPTPRPDHSRQLSSRTPANVSVATEGTNANESALEQLFTAANNLGLDHNALNDLLARSGSISSKTLLGRNNSVVNTSKRAIPNESLGESRLDVSSIQQLSFTDSGGTFNGSSGSDHTATPGIFSTLPPDNQNGQPVVEGSKAPEETISRKPSIRKPDHLRRPREGQTEINPVVRRTIIYPSDSRISTVDAALTRKASSRRRRASATSVSTRSVQDRAPTPPPPKSPTAKRFSQDGSPPVPHLPHSLGQAESLLQVPSVSASGPIEKSNSTYDSLYEMYAEESRAASSATNDPNFSENLQSGVTAESRPALEVVELANGETIWKIVNGLRDDDDESNYTGRYSFASEYSTRENGGEAVQVFVKDHGRSASKGSNSSFVSRKKTGQGKSRPETKVFYSSSAQIGRLIESLSQGMDAGSFNFRPNRSIGHSASSSVSTNDINWTVEERLEHMLGAIGGS